MPRIHDASKREEDSCERMDSQEYENRTSHGHKSLASLFQDRTASWVRIVYSVDKYETESILTKEEGDIASVKPIAKAYVHFRFYSCS